MSCRIDAVLRVFLSTALLLVVVGIAHDRGEAVMITYDHRDTFLAETRSTSITVPIPNLGVSGGLATIGIVTFRLVDETATLYVGGREFGEDFDWTALNPGHEMKIFGLPHMTVELPRLVHVLGFDGVEHNKSFSCRGCTPSDSIFVVTLWDRKTRVGDFTFNLPDDERAFVGVNSTTPFSRMELGDLADDPNDTYFVEF